MKRVGILTHYHNTMNYGGALQAYALCKTLSLMGYLPEQIDINFHGKFTILDRKRNLIYSIKAHRILKPVRLIYRFIKKTINGEKNFNQNNLKIIWEKAFFNLLCCEIPHSKQQYDDKNIIESISDYDVFITGSDQVWNPNAYFKPFFLTFVQEDKKKISYAASISQKNLSEKEKKVYASHLKSFDAISVRESNAVELLSEVTDKKVEHVLDPTLLLDKDGWEEITADRLINEPYVFCYFLGNDNAMRQRAKDYAVTKKIRLVNIKHVCGIYHSNDLDFGDIVLDVATPNEFLSLIRHADMVFTDSFHASVFSIIFEKQFFCFARCECKDMEVRIESLMQLFDLEERYLGQPESALLERILQTADIQYPLDCPKYEEMKQQSYEFLRRSIG